MLGVPPEGRVRITYEEVPGEFADGTEVHAARADLRDRRPERRAARRRRAGVAAHRAERLRRRAARGGARGGRSAATPIPTTPTATGSRDGEHGVGRRPQQHGARSLRVEGQRADRRAAERRCVHRRHRDHELAVPRAAVHRGRRRSASPKPTGGDPELDDHKLDRVTFYTRTLAVPARRDVTERRRCRRASSCSAPPAARRVTCRPCAPVTSRRRRARPSQTIHPYTDLLLHDMGAGLADGRPDHLASGREWRTPPLWGIGLQSTVSGHTRFLHDGRARNLEEAILWHGGEAQGGATSVRARCREPTARPCSHTFARCEADRVDASRGCARRRCVSLTAVGLRRRHRRVGEPTRGLPATSRPT